MMKESRVGSRESSEEKSTGNKFLNSRLLILLSLLLTACGGKGLGDTFGFNRTAPDEFTVVSRPSLTVPPDFNLVPPRPGEPPRQPRADEAARSIITGKTTAAKADDLVMPKVDTAVTPVVTNDAPTPATEAFLKRIGADKADETIRAQLGEDLTKPVDTSNAKSLYERIIGQDKLEPVVDAKKESERLRQNKDDGKPANEGEVPTEPPKPPSVIDKIF